MTDYNDGKWHGWNGGECPVDPLCEVECIYPASDMQNDSPYWSVSLAKVRNWKMPFLFRVTASPKPREWWLLVRANGDIKVSHEKITACGCHDRIIHVREVLPE